MTEMEIAGKSIRGSLILFVGNLAFTVTSGVSLILIARMLQPTNYGVYTLALVIPNLFLSLIDFGLYTAVIRFSSYYNSTGKTEAARHFTINAVRFLWLVGSVFSILNFVLAGFLSNVLLHRPEMTPYVQLMSLSIIGNTILSTVMNSAIGWNWMGLSSFSQVLQSIFKLVLSPLLIVVGFGVFGTLAGYVTSLIAAGLIGTLLLNLTKLRGAPVPLGSFVTDVTAMLRFGIAPYTGSLVSVVANYYLTLLLAAIASNTTFGLYQAAVNFITPITLVSSALVYGLLPAFSSIDGTGGDVRNAFRKAYKFVAFVLTPVIFFLISAAKLLLGLFYGASFLATAHYLQLLALAYLPIAFGYTVHPAFFNGFGKTRFTFIMNVSAAATLAGGASLFSIVFALGVNGLILAIFVSFLVAWLTGTVLAHRYMHASMDFRATGAILLVSALSYSGTLPLPLIPFSDAMALLLDVVVFVGIYLTLAPLVRAINAQDIRTLELTMRDLRFIDRLASPILRYERLILGLTHRA